LIFEPLVCGCRREHPKLAESTNTAFCSSLNGSTGTNKDDARIEMWWRATNDFRKVDGKWLVTHGHSSEPFDTASGKALVDLKP
jgi:ketosteroid isomerase-like protein